MAVGWALMAVTWDACFGRGAPLFVCESSIRERKISPKKKWRKPKPLPDEQTWPRPVKDKTHDENWRIPDGYG